LKQFLAWVNGYLNRVNESVSNFARDFQTGCMLIVLVEQISGRSLGRYHRNPRFPSQKLENAKMALEFIGKHFGLTIVGITPQGTFELVVCG
jgi:filamin